MTEMRQSQRVPTSAGTVTRPSNVRYNSLDFQPSGRTGKSVVQRILSPRDHVPKMDSNQSIVRPKKGPLITSVHTGDEVNNEPTTLSFYNQPSPTIELVATPYGNFEIPNYKIMSSSDIQIHRASWGKIIQQLNKDYKDVLDTPIPEPTRVEDIRSLAVRVKQSHSYLTSSSGSHFWFVIFAIGCGFIEHSAKEMGYPSKGYAKTQIELYEPVYEKYLKQFSITSGFGKDWPPWMQIIAISAATLILNIMLRKSPSLRKKSANIISVFMEQMTGNTSTPQIKINSEGNVIEPPKLPRKNEGSDNPFGGMMDMMGTMMSGGDSGGIANFIGGMFGGGAEKKSKKKRNKERIKRMEEEDFGV